MTRNPAAAPATPATPATPAARAPSTQPPDQDRGAGRSGSRRPQLAQINLRCDRARGERIRDRMTRLVARDGRTREEHYVTAFLRYLDRAGHRPGDADLPPLSAAADPGAQRRRRGRDTTVISVKTWTGDAVTIRRRMNVLAALTGVFVGDLYADAAEAYLDDEQV